MSGFMHVEDDPGRRDSVMVQLQGIVDAIAATHGGTDDPVPIQEELSSAIDAAGLPEQPEKWVGDTAGEIAAGRTVVLDRSTESVPDLAASVVRARAEQAGD